MDKAKVELEAYKKYADVQMEATKEGLNQTIDKDQAALQNDHLQASLEIFNYLSNHSEAKTNAFLKDLLKTKSGEMEKELAEITDKNSCAYKAQRFVKDWLDIRIASDEKKLRRGLKPMLHWMLR